MAVLLHLVRRFLRPKFLLVKAMLLVSLCCFLLGVWLFVVPVPGTSRVGYVFFGKPFTTFSCQQLKNGTLNCASEVKGSVLVAESLAQIEDALGLDGSDNRELVGSPMALWYAEAEVYRTETTPQYEILDLNEARFFAAIKIDSPNDSVEDFLGSTSSTPPFAMMLILSSVLFLSIAALINSYQVDRQRLAHRGSDSNLQ